jgi:hypothetical protein
VGGGVFHELGFLPLYSLSDSRLPILGRNGAGLSWLSGLGIRWILCPERSPWNSLQLCLMSLWKNPVLFLLFGSIILVFSLMLYLGWLGACSHMLDSYKVPISLYDHLVFDFWCHLMLRLMLLCRFAWLWPLLLS